MKQIKPMDTFECVLFEQAKGKTRQGQNKPTAKPVWHTTMGHHRARGQKIPT